MPNAVYPGAFEHHMDSLRRGTSGAVAAPPESQPATPETRPATPVKENGRPCHARTGSFGSVAAGVPAGRGPLKNPCPAGLWLAAVWAALSAALLAAGCGGSKTAAPGPRRAAPASPSNVAQDFQHRSVCHPASRFMRAVAVVLRNAPPIARTPGGGSARFPVSRAFATSPAPSPSGRMFTTLRAFPARTPVRAADHLRPVAVALRPPLGRLGHPPGRRRPADRQGHRPARVSLLRP